MGYFNFFFERAYLLRFYSGKMNCIKKTLPLAHNVSKFYIVPSSLFSVVRLQHHFLRRFSTDEKLVFEDFFPFSEGEIPQELPDEKYPDWLWTIHHPLPTRFQLLRKAKLDWEGMTQKEKKRLFKLERKH